MSAPMKFVLIHALGLILVCFGGRAFAETAEKSLDRSILVTVGNWQSPAVDNPESLKSKYSDVLKKFEGSADQKVVLEALAFLESNATKVPNKEYLTLIDYGKSAETKRLSLVNLRTGNIEKYNVASGKGSDPDHDGIATSFSNEPNSYKTSLGFYLTLDDYYSEKFESKALRLEGLSSSNSNALDRAIVIHGAWYVDPANGIYGRSEGCPALDKRVAEQVINKIRDGSLILAYK